MFQSSFELTGYITKNLIGVVSLVIAFQSSFELTGYITAEIISDLLGINVVSKLFRAYGLYNLCSLEGARILNPSGLFAIGFKKVDKKCV